MKEIKGYSIFIFSRLFTSFYPLFQIIFTKFISVNPIDLSKIILLIAIQTQLSLFIAANRDEKLFIETEKKSLNLSIFKEILKRIYFSFIFGFPISILIFVFFNWDINFFVLYLSFAFSSHISLHKLISLGKNEKLVILNILISFFVYLIILFFTKNVFISFLISSLVSIFIYFLKFIDFDFIKTISINKIINFNSRNMMRDIVALEQNEVRASSIVVFLSTRLDQFALAAMAASSNPFVITYLTLKKFIDFAGNFFVLLYSRDTFEKTSTYSNKVLIEKYSRQLIRYLLLIILICSCIILITIKIYGFGSSIIVFLISLAAILNNWGSQKGPAYTRYKLQKKNFYFLLIALLAAIPIYKIMGFNLISTISSSLITALLVNLILPIIFIEFDRKLIIRSLRIISKK